MTWHPARGRVGLRGAGFGRGSTLWYGRRRRRRLLVVGRATEAELFQACSQHWLSLNPPPDPTTWSGIADPGERLRTALGELYRWDGWAEPMLLNVTRDAPLVPAMEAPMRAFGSMLAQMQAALMAGRRERGSGRRRAAAAIGLALAFTTWQSLTRQAELGDSEAVALMAATIEQAGEVRRTRR